MPNQGILYNQTVSYYTIKSLWSVSLPDPIYQGFPIDFISTEVIDRRRLV